MVKIVVEFYPSVFVSDAVRGRKKRLIEGIEKAIEEAGFKSDEFSVYLTFVG